MNRPLQTLTLAAALSCTMATGWASILTQTPNQKNNDYEMFMEKIRNTTIKNPSIDKNLALFQENGSFSDIDYDDTQMTNWTPIQHIERFVGFRLRIYQRKEQILSERRFISENRQRIRILV